MENFESIKNSVFEFVEQKSRFIAFSYYVSGNFKALLQNIKKAYPDATHICYGFRIIDEKALKNSSIKILEDFSDDGEPGLTAGLQILNAIKKEKLFNTAVVVVRYFGGVKLGTGGLIKAYKKAAENVLYSKTECAILNGFEARCDYNNFNKLKNLEQYKKLYIKDPIFDDEVSFNVFTNDTFLVEGFITKKLGLKIFEENT